MPKSINFYRTQRYRVFYAEPYFDNNLKYEITWHTKHLKKLKKHAKKPHLFHKKRTSGELEEHHHRHHKEHVIDSIPFHEKILNQHIKRLKVITSLMSKRIYNKLNKISMRYGGTPDYFVYDKTTKKFFFVCHKPDDAKKTWINLVKSVYKICDIIILDNM